MDFINKAASSLGGGGSSNNNNNNNQNEGQQQQGGEQKQEGGLSGLMSGFTNKANEAAGGGRESEKNEDYLDKGIDLVQEKFLGQGAQDNESAVEQAKDEKISDFIRGQYKSQTGKDIPIQDKPTALDRSTD